MPTAGWWSRFGAYVLDSIVETLAFGALYLVGAAIDTDVMWVIVFVAIFGFIFFYQPLMIRYYDGQTLGKRALRVRVLAIDGRPIGFGRACVREIGLKTIPGFLSPLNLVDYLWAAFRDDRRTLHDLAAGTFVVEAGEHESSRGLGRTPG